MSSPVSIGLKNDEGRIVDCMSWLFNKPHRVEVKQQWWKSHSACQDVHLRKHLEVVKNSHNGTLEDAPVELCMIRLVVRQLVNGDLRIFPYIGRC